MANPFKRIFGFGRLPDDDNDDSGKFEAVSQWAATQGFSIMGRGEGFLLGGKVNQKSWKLERGAASRDFIHGEELRARAELGIGEDVTVLIINRVLKDELEQRAYQLQTRELRSGLASKPTEEMRWLSTYTEVGWDSLPDAFWDRYAVLADQRHHALAWIDPNLANMLLDWPEPGPDARVPFILMLLRGNAYLRMQYTPSGFRTLEHAAALYTNACESALAGLGGM